MMVINGASPEGDRAVAVPAEPKVSALQASIPSASRVGVTGTQNGLTQPQKEALCSVFIGLREGGATWQHNGDCVGADEYAGTVWRFLGGSIHLHPPTISSKRAYLKGHEASEPRPYMDRNSDIVAASDILVAMPKEAREEMRSGTWSTVRRARKLLRPIIFVWPNGHWSIEMPAQAIEARSDETGTESAEGNSRVPKGCTQDDAPEAHP